MRLTVLALVALLTVTSALARASETGGGLWHSSDWRGSHRYLAQRQADIGADAAAARVREATGGRVLRVQRDKRGVYQVKVLLPGGRVRVVPVDGRTGRILQ